MVAVFVDRFDLYARYMKEKYTWKMVSDSSLIPGQLEEGTKLLFIRLKETRSYGQHAVWAKGEYWKHAGISDDGRRHPPRQSTCDTLP